MEKRYGYMILTRVIYLDENTHPPPLIKIKNENNQLQFTNKMLLMTQKKPTENMKIN